MQSTIKSCEGQTLCLETVVVDGETFVGLGPACNQRISWINEQYLTLTDSEHYRQPGDVVPAASQRWLLGFPGGCAMQLSRSYPEGGDRLIVDPGCRVGPEYEYEFWALISKRWMNASVDAINEPFALVESGDDTSRRIAYYVNTTVVDGGGCRCVDLKEGDPLGRLMVSRGHMHLVHHVHPTHSYFAQVDHCEGHIFSIILASPSPPPPRTDEPPPAPPYEIRQITMATSALATTGFFFLCFCSVCGVMGFTTQARGNGRSKWWGTKELRIIGEPPDGRNQFATTGDFFASLPSAERPLLQ